MTRLADVSGLTPFGVPVFQAIRPLSRSLTVSQGKGLTPMAAKVSALLEAAELAVAERLPAPPDRLPLAALGPETRELWATGPRPSDAIRLDPDVPRGWVEGRCLSTGRPTPVPFDLLSLDFTRAPATHAFASSSGLATGNTRSEAMAAALAEVLERDLTAAFWGSTRRDRRGCEIDQDTVDDPALRPLLNRIARTGFAVRLWSIGDGTGVAATLCALIAPDAHPVLPPTIGSGCHPSRRVAALRAVLEAVQVHATLAAGARDDVEPRHYAEPGAQRRDLIWETLSLARADRAWSSVPDDYPCPSRVDHASRAFDLLLAAAARRTTLPMIGVEHPGAVAGLTVFRVLAPGLRDPARTPSAAEPAPFPPSPTPPAQPRAPPYLRTRPVVFVGPSLRREDVPSAVEVRPPAVAGDLAQLLADPPLAVGLIDGCFETSPTVWHKEILHLLAIGVPVLGGASLGALRAAELDGLGMRGIGRVYAAYRDGWIERDDAVMLPHAPPELGHRPLGVSLVDMEAALGAADLAPPDRRQLQRLARRLHHAERTWERCLTGFEMLVRRPAPVSAASLAAHPSVKRADALELIAALSTAARIAKRPMPPMTSHYRRLLARVMPAPR